MSSGGNRVIGPGRAVDAEAGDSAILAHQTEPLRSEWYH